jgi:hypothetical protein
MAGYLSNIDNDINNDFCIVHTETNIDKWKFKQIHTQENEFYLSKKREGKKRKFGQSGKRI